MKEEKSVFGTVLLHFQMLRKQFLIWHKTEKKKAFSMVQIDGILKFAGVLAKKRVKSFLRQIVLPEREPFAQENKKKAKLKITEEV